MIGFKFLNRLLNIRNVLSDCFVEVYNLLVLMIFVCFFFDEEFCEYFEMIKKILLFLNGIFSLVEIGVGEGSVEDCF